MAQFAALIGAGISAYGKMSAGDAARKAGIEAERQARRAAGLTRASTQRDAMEEERQARLANSRVQALAAASGGGASDLNVTNLMADIAGEGRYRGLSRLWEGEEEARGIEAQGRAYRKEGNAKRNASYLDAASSLFQAYGQAAGGGSFGGGG